MKWEMFVVIFVLWIKFRKKFVQLFGENNFCGKGSQIKNYSEFELSSKPPADAPTWRLSEKNKILHNGEKSALGPLYQQH